MADGTRSGKRRVRIPHAVFDQIELKIAIQEDAERSRRFL